MNSCEYNILCPELSYLNTLVIKTVFVGILSPTANVSVANNILIKFFENNISIISLKTGISPA